MPFVFRHGLLRFLSGQVSLNLDLTILPDSRPEMDESFSVQLSSPTGGGILSSNPNLAITILSNNNAYGRIAFADNSLNVNVTELQWNSIFKLDIVREFGSFGQISLNWNMSSVDGSSVTDLFPTQGQVNLNQGVSSASIFINVRPDGIPELDEKFVVRYDICHFYVLLKISSSIFSASYFLLNQIFTPNVIFDLFDFYFLPDRLFICINFTQ